MNFFILSLVIYGVTATPIGSTSNNQRITKGSNAFSGQFPYLALIRHSENLQAFCAGSIMNNKWILTTALCIEIFEPTSSAVRVVVGSIYLNRGGTTHTVLSLVKHPDHVAQSITNDLGLIQVNGQISYNDFVQPIELYDDSTSVGLPLTIIGWGATSFWPTLPEIIFPSTLQFANFKAMSLDECKTLVQTNIFPLSESHLCTYSTSHWTSLCVYDNGNPVVYNGVLHGVVSVPLSCVYQLPDIHTRVEHFRSWIEEITNA